MSPDSDRQLEGITRGFVTLSGGERERCDIMLRYSIDDPLVVGLIVSRPGYGSSGWVISRDLLSAGLTGTAGIGDITVEPVAEPSKKLRVLVRVRNEVGEARIHIDHQALLLYLERSHAMMPFGSEAQTRQADAELDQLLDEDQDPPVVR
ncbi:SsgA family sporulation/cell division regulator [Streptomyces sp. AcE210]|uniref:SsgA family sporulation/cell division regulator n=1 Tax=Streptomyces sp. AcE210 TaxID=2292703 RepID=UPI001404D8F6|nr:SsgA family sporulation/cell division regulator [Streptomyces sp. AcE210]